MRKLNHLLLWSAIGLCGLIGADSVLARGGGGGGRGGGGGGARAGGGGGAHFSGGGGGARPSMPSARPSAPRPSAPRPSAPRPSAPRPSQSMARPSTGINRTPSMSGVHRPSTLPAQVGGGGVQRPGSGNFNRPGTGNLNRPNMGGGNNLANRPNIGGGNNFANRPNIGGGGTVANRPNFGPGGLNPNAHPSTSDLGNFLNLPGTRPGAGGAGERNPFNPGDFANRPGAGGAGERNPFNPGDFANRPGAGGAGERNPNNRDDLGNRDDRVDNRLDNRGDRQDIRDDQQGNRDDRQGNRDDRQGNRDDRQGNRDDRQGNRNDRADNRQQWRSDMPNNVSDRMAYRQGWANGVHNNWNNHRQDFWNEFKDDFGEPGWRLEYPRMGNAYFRYNHPYAHGWWTVATVAGLTSWATSGWGQPVYYDYGTGGNVYYEGDTVYQDNQPVATTEEYTQQAQDLAMTGAEALSAPVDPAKPVEWMPLGTFALSTSADEKSPTRVMQLAISKEGIINGTMFNTVTDKTSPIQGAVDSKTQRASFFAGDKTDVVAETGVYNLTKDEAPLLVHFGQDRTEEYLLVRLPPPAESATAKQ